ncbi:hypothetical protein MARPO_0015s0164 [Marchantia polymorpha]|uniref:TF-B3 domain-containing protein n=1 Tax=Marchantia polymorpha TaxID=3197 RepID=A0A2R6XGZ2_MARPO|nr:hypothetical protein MARPO_0015s0164 [Marchantia polymorpha]|eukprot:PTQ45376.1 hypothetical protein MARPO_0015s0164 [Marchantia polymorpha]
MATDFRRDLEPASGKLTYEEARLKRIEDNKKRMEELGLKDQLSLFTKSPSKTNTPRKAIKKNLQECAVEIRRSPRVTRKPSVNYYEKNRAEVEGTGCPRKRIGRVLKRGFISPAARSEASVRASEIKTGHPSFVKAMLRSHTSGGFWLGLPSDFCITHFRKDELVILEDEDGLEWETIYLHHKKGLSGGWRGFSIDHDLEDGDAVVFELVKPTRFKVHITRAVGSKSLECTPNVALRSKSYRYALKENKENEHVNSALHKVLKREQQETEDAENRVSKRRAKLGAKSLKRKLDLSEDSACKYSVGDEPLHKKVIIEVSDSDNESPGDAGLKERQKSSGRRILRHRPPATKSVEKPVVPPLNVKISKGETQRNNKNGEEKNVHEPQRRKVTEAIQTPVVDKKKGVVLTKKVTEAIRTPVVDKKKGVVLTKKVTEAIQPPFVDKKKGVVLTKKVRFAAVPKTSACATTKSSLKLPPGAKIKAWGVCSIARNCNMSRKLPGTGTRKYSFFSPGKRPVAKAR